MTKVKIQYTGDLRTVCTHLDSGIRIETDAPKDVGGKGAAFSPTDLLGVSVASCMLTTMALAAARLGFDLEGLAAEVEKEMVSVPVRRIGKLVIRIRCPHSPSPQIQGKLEQAALGCPAHASLHPEVKQEIDFVWGI